ncbi:MAG: SGNH/GDSL hydrolase family protein [Euzebyales bacterium]|jgi:lysophospholipase L1-like esterase|nr:SGNH/GDSL hydrolase family protein [Euzebyales bacterium]
MPAAATRSPSSSLRRRLGLALLGAPFAFLGLLVVQGLLAARAEYLPTEPDYRIDTHVVPDGDGEGSGSAAQQQPAPLRMVVLGDSTAAGVGSPTLDTSLPVLIAQRVADQLGRPVAVTGLGSSGAVTRDVVEHQVPAVADLAPDVVVAVVGSNDVTHGTPPWRLRDDVADLRAAVGDATDAPLVLAGIPLFGSADALGQPLRWVVDAYASVLRDVQRAAAAANGVPFVEIARDASPRFRGVPEAMSSDGFHPAPVGYGFWADAIAPVTVEAAS